MILKTNLPIMQDTLKKELCRYVESNNPDILIDLSEVNLVSTYIENKVAGIANLLKKLIESDTPDYIIEETCMEELTRDLKPSKYNYIVRILEEDFEFAYQQFNKLQMLQYEIINMMAQCEQTFHSFNFNEGNEDIRDLRYAITGIISEYLDGSL